VEEEKLNVAMFSIHSCPVGELGTKDTGGMNVYIRELAGELGNRGHRVDIYTRVHDPNDPQVIHLNENARVIHLRAGKNGYMHKVAIYPYLDHFTGALENFILRENLHYDLIHSHYWLSGQVGRWAQARWNVPHMLMFHTLGAVKNNTGVGEEEPLLRITTERQIVQNCHRIIAALKGIDRLLKAMTHLRHHNGLKLVIIGGDGHGAPEFEAFQRLSSELGINDMISFIGRIEQGDLPPYYSAADLLAVPSYHESFGLVALEALACGTPVVATEVGAMNSVICEGKTGSVVADSRPQAFARAIHDFFSKPRHAMESADSIRNSVRPFNWSHVAKAMIEKYESMLADFNFSKMKVLGARAQAAQSGRTTIF